MKRQRWWLPLVALLFVTNWKLASTLPVPDDEVDTSTKLLGSSVVTSVSVVTGSSDNVADDNSMKKSIADRMRVIPSRDLPGSPADLMRPDRFQFYTYNEKGNVVTKQMTKQQIHSLIAAGGGHLPMEIHEPQKAGDVPAGGMKVSDVVQNVQNVLKGELNKPTTVMTSMPTIPGHVNTEWSSILPAILGGESESAPVSEPISTVPIDMSETTVEADDRSPVKNPGPVDTQTSPGSSLNKEPAMDHESSTKPAGILEPETHNEKPMIQVPVITVDQKLPPHQTDEDVMPAFQMLNTISADKIETKNKTHVEEKPKPVESEHVNLGETEIVGKPEILPAKPDFVKEPVMGNSTVPVDKHPEMIKINFDSGIIKPSDVSGLEKPLVKPQSGIITAETISNSAESEPTANVTVISETHSTSMKVSGHEEIPLREPPKPLTEAAVPLRVTSDITKPENSTTLVSSTDTKLDATTLKVPVTTEQPTEVVTEPGLFAQGVSFFGNLPQTVSSIVTDFISNNKPSPIPVTEESDSKVPVKTSPSVEESVGTIETVKILEPTKSPMPQTTIASIHETVTSVKPLVNQEPVFQIMPEMIPDKERPAHGSLSSEASSIEHIIETLNDPAGSLSGTVAADHLMGHETPESKLNVTKVIEPEITKTSIISKIEASTTVRSISAQLIPAETSSTKPMEALPTELADSLSSMISQISDAMPSVLPVSEKAGLDTTEKKTAANVNAEEHTTEDVKTPEAQVTSKRPEAPANRIQLPVQTVTEKPEAVSTKEPAREEPTTVGTVEVKETTEKLKVISSTDLPASTSPVTTQSLKLDKPTTVKIDVPLVTKESPEVSPEAQKLKAAGPESDKSKLDIDEVQASSDITTDKLIPQAVAQESAKTETVTELAVTDVSIEKTGTVKPAGTVASSGSSTVSNISVDQTEVPIKIQTDRPVILQEAAKLENEMTEMPIETETNENNTELPIVRIDITEAKPTQFTHVNKTQVTGNADSGMESPLVRIKLTDPVTVINNLIASANVDVSPSSIAPLSLPKTGSVPPSNIASGIIAGYPTSTTQSTSSANLTEDNPTTTIETATSLPEVQIVNDSPVSNVTGIMKPSDAEVDSTMIETPGPFELNGGRNTSEKIESSETSTLKDLSTATTEIPLNRIDLSKGPEIVESPEKITTDQASSIPQTSTEKSTLDETIAELTTSKSIEIELPATVAPSEKKAGNLNASTLLVENVTSVAEVTTMKSNVSPIGEVPVNRIEIPALSIVQQTETGEKLNESPKIIEKTDSASLKPEITTGQSVLTEIKIESPEVDPVSTNSTKSEVPDVKIDAAPEKLPEIPTKIQLTDLPIVGMTARPKKPMKNAVVEGFRTTQKPQSLATMQIPVVAPDDDNKGSWNVSLQETTVRTLEKTTVDPDKEDPKLEVAPKKPVNISEESNLLREKIDESPITGPQTQTEEIRIQVNDTAVLVTKRPVLDAPSQKPGDVQKIPVNPSIDEPTTPKIASITEDPYAKLGEKIQLPVPVKVSELSASYEGVAVDTSIKMEPVGASSGTETRIRLGEEQQADKTKDEKLPATVDEPKKPIKKKTDSDLPTIDKNHATSMNKKPISINERPFVNREKDSNPQSSTKVEMAKPISSNMLSNGSKVAKPIKVDPKPTKLPDKGGPVRVITEKPVPKPVKPAHKPTMNIKKDDAPPRPAEHQWTLIPQQVYPTLTKTGGSHGKRPTTTEEPPANIPQNDQKIPSPEIPPVSLDHPQSAHGLDSTVKNLETDISYFANLCNELAFTFWTATNKGLSTARSLAVSPFGMTSMLAMVFLGARGPTSDQMNDILKLDDVASFNPHLIFQNVTDAVGLARNQGIANAAFVRELFADRSKVRNKLMPFYKEQAQQFYDGVVAEVNFATISDLVRRRTNLMIRKQTGGRIKDFVRTNTVPLRSPLAALSANVFQTDCNSSAASSEGRDGELYFAVSPAVRQRKLVPVPATVWRAGVLAGYEPSLDATAIALGGVDKLVSTIFIIPGQQGHMAPGDTLDRLEQRLIRGAAHDGSWNKLLKVLIPRPGLELQVPKFSHRSVINATAALKRMGLEELFSRQADLKGINGVATDLHLADVLQMNLFSTCGDENIINGRHHVEVYPGSPLRNARKFNKFEEQTDNGFTDYPSNEEEQGFEGSALPYLPQRQARSAKQNDATEKQRLKLDRPFLYFVRHNPTGLILHMGRFNPRLLP